MKLLSLLLLCSLPVLCQQVSGNGGGGSSSNIVSSVATGCGLTGGTITSTGTISSQELVNAQTGTTYTYLTTDCGKLVTHSNSGAIAATLPQAGSTGFAAGWWMDVEDTGAGTLTITPTTSTINGAATLVLTTKTGSRIVSDGTNYQLQTGGFANPMTTAGTCIGSSAGGTPIAVPCPSVLSYGAVPDAIRITDATMTNGSAVLNTATVFPASAAGKWECVVGGAGTTTGGFTYNLVANVSTVVAGVPTLSSPAGTTLLTYAVTGATNAAPIVLSVASTTGLYQGEQIIVTGVGGNTAANGTWIVGTLTSTTLQLLNNGGLPSLGNAAYTSGGLIAIPSDCGTPNNTAFNATIAATNGGGFTVPGNIGTGRYLLSNANASGMSLTNWSGAVRFTQGAQLVCDTVQASGDPCIYINGSNGFVLDAAQVVFAGNPRMLKASGGANALQINQSTNGFINDFVAIGSGSSCITDNASINVMYKHINLSQCTVNGFFSASSQDLHIEGLSVAYAGDFALEVDNYSGGIYPSTAQGAMITGVSVRNSFGGIGFESKLNAKLSDFTIDGVCVTALPIGNQGQGSGTPAHVNITNGTINNAGNFSDPLWNVVSGCAGLGQGTAMAWTAVTDLFISHVSVTNTNGVVFGGTGGLFVSLNDIRLSNNTGTMNITGNGYLELSKIHIDNASKNLEFSSNTKVVARDINLTDVCTSASCTGGAGVALYLLNNTQFNISGVSLNDDQGSPTGYKIASSGTTNQSTINNVEGVIAHGSFSSSLDANTLLDPQSFGSVISTISQISSAPTNPCTPGLVEVRTDTGVLYSCMHGLWIGNDATSLNVTESFFGSGSLASSGQIGSLGWVVSNIGAAPSLSLGGLTGFPHPGTWNMATTGTAGQGGTLWMGSSGQPGNLGTLGNSSPWWAEWISAPSVGSSLEWRLGFGPSATTTAIPTAFIGFRFDDQLKNVASATCNDAGNKCGLTTLTCSTTQTVTFTINGGTATGSVACTGTNAIANTTAITVVSGGAGYNSTGGAAVGNVTGGTSSVHTGSIALTTTLGAAASGPDTVFMACVSTASLETCTPTVTSPATNTFNDFYISSATAQNIQFQIGTGTAVSICPSSCILTGTPPTTGLGPLQNIVTGANSIISVSVNYFQYLASGLSR